MLTPLTAAEGARAFAALRSALARFGLPDENGRHSMRSVTEFMFMDTVEFRSKGETWWAFKSIRTRNRILVSTTNADVIIPTMDEPFMRGVF